MTIPICISGITGKMGKTIVGLAHKEKYFKVVSALESPSHPCLGKSFNEIFPEIPVSCILTGNPSEALQGVKVLIDFTSPVATLQYINTAIEFKTAMVIGTTGFSEHEKSIIQEAALKIPIVFSPNMSLGMNVLFNLVQEAAKKLGTNYDVEIIEMHHNLKKDAPSGSAIRLGELIAKVWNKNLSQILVNNRNGSNVVREKGTLALHAVRAGDIIGDHTVLLASNGERIELTHRAQSRDSFGHGALRAAKFVSEKKSGLYDMNDVLNSDVNSTL
jgi:4-hydroxy-tetrahydrodipicolinate reductase